jgi:hypothetical protein
MSARSKFDGKAEPLIAALLTESFRRRGGKVGLSEATVQRWLKDSAFLGEYRVARRGCVEEPSDGCSTRLARRWIPCGGTCPAGRPAELPAPRRCWNTACEGWRLPTCSIGSSTSNVSCEEGEEAVLAVTVLAGERRRVGSQDRWGWRICHPLLGGRKY